MKNKNTKRLYPLLLILAVIVGIIFFSMNNSGMITELSVTRNLGVSCNVWANVIDIDVTGRERFYSGGNLGNIISPLINFEVLSASGQVMSRVDTSSFVSCKALSSSLTNFNLVGGTIKTSFYGTTETGQLVFLKQVDRNVSTIPQTVLNKQQSLPSGTILGSEINSKLTSSQEFLSTKLKIKIIANLQFKGTTTGTLVNTGDAYLTVDIPIRLHNPVKTPVPSTSTVVDLKRLSQSVFDLKDYSTRSLLLTATGELPQWKSSEGVPYVKVIDPSGKTVGTYSMSSNRLISSSTNTYEFSTLNLVLPKLPLGIYKIEMHSNNDIRKISSQPSTDTMIVQIYDTSIKSPPPPTPVPTLQCMKLSNNAQEICLSDDEFKLGGACYAQTLQWCVDFHNAIITKSPVPKPEVGTASAYYDYKIQWSNGEVQTRSASSTSLPLLFEEFAFIGGDSNVNSRTFSTAVLNPLIKFPDSSMSVQSASADVSYKVIWKGKTIVPDGKFNAVQYKQVLQPSVTGTTFNIGTITLNSVDITNIIKATIPFPSYVGEPTQVLVTGDTIDFIINMDAELIAVSNGIKKKAVINDMQFTLPLKYIDGTQTAEPCTGLSGTALLACLDNSDDDGDGVKNDVDECPDKIGNAQNNGCPPEGTVPDRDGDGVRDDTDKCPDVAGIVENDGCPSPVTCEANADCPADIDSDGDGVVDSKDLCPNDAGSPQNNGCKLEQSPKPYTGTDSDGDGILDEFDACPTVAGVIAKNGCPTKESTDPDPVSTTSLSDSDGDGVQDSFDACPSTKGLMSNKGCPATEVGENGEPKQSTDAVGICPEGMPTIECINLIKGSDSSLLLVFIMTIVIIVVVVVITLKKRN